MCIVPYYELNVKLIMFSVTDIDTDHQIGAKGQRGKGTEGVVRGDVSYLVSRIAYLAGKRAFFGKGAGSWSKESQ